ncbi:MAG: phenylalanine--tRNA ligase subunit alpha [Candidatus Micrarchaeota archaeon]
MEYKYEHEILDYLKTMKNVSLAEIATALKLNQDALMRPLISLEEKGLIKKDIVVSKMIVFTEEGKNYLKNRLPEIRVYQKIADGKDISSFTADEKQFGIKWAMDKGLVKFIEGKFVPEKKLSAYEISEYSKSYLSQSANSEEWLKRGIAVEKSKKEITLWITDDGINAKFGEEGITKLTSEMLRTGTWKKRGFKEYDVSVPAKDAHMGKIHPITEVIERVRLIFSELGFEEMEGNYIESAFWNFDALFQPQDHPARELADTFYLEGEEPLPDKKLVENVKKAHEKGWENPWNEAEAKRRVLRTHTTALSARYLASMKNTPKKYFAIGRVFRNEATDYKHLAEFQQLEGIIAWENATFRDLLGILKEFYSKLGFERIKFRPSYFPYTEPSLEIIVYFNEKKEWVEMGGAGILRPEVSLPLANVYPVLAWGLSLERPLMMLMDIDDIRTFYKNDLTWLKSARVKL